MLQAHQFHRLHSVAPPFSDGSFVLSEYIPCWNANIRYKQMYIRSVSICSKLQVIELYYTFVTKNGVLEIGSLIMIERS